MSKSTCFQKVVHHCVFTVASAASIYADGSTTPAVQDTGGEMVKGLALGFGLFFGILILLCVVCCLCCNNSCHCSCCCKKKEKPRKTFPRRRVGPSPSPSPPRSGTITRSTIVSGRS